MGFCFGGKKITKAHELELIEEKPSIPRGREGENIRGFLVSFYIELLILARIVGLHTG
jgi:hypothetical protein